MLVIAAVWKSNIKTVKEEHKDRAKGWENVSHFTQKSVHCQV